MALTARCFVTLNNVKDYLNISSSDATKDTTFETWLDLICGEIEEACDTEIQPQETEIFLDGNGSKVLNLGRFIEDLYGDNDTEKLASLQYRTDSQSDWTDLTDDMDNVEFDGRSIVLLYDDFFPLGRKNIRVKFYAGFDPVPAKLKRVALEEFAMMYKESNLGTGQLGVQSLNTGSTTSATFKDIASRWQSVFDEYLDPLDDENVSTIYL